MLVTVVGQQAEKKKKNILANGALHRFQRDEFEKSVGGDEPNVATQAKTHFGRSTLQRYLGLLTLQAYVPRVDVGFDAKALL